MAISTDPIIPLNVNVALNYSQTLTTGTPIQLTLNPKNGDGTDYDCSDVTTLNLHFDNNKDGTINVSSTQALSGANITVGATGIVAKLAKGMGGTVVAALKTYNGRLTAEVTDGANNMVLGYGTWTCSLRS